LLLKEQERSISAKLADAVAQELPSLPSVVQSRHRPTPPHRQPRSVLVAPCAALLAVLRAPWLLRLESMGVTTKLGEPQANAKPPRGPRQSTPSAIFLGPASKSIARPLDTSSTAPAPPSSSLLPHRHRLPTGRPSLLPRRLTGERSSFPLPQMGSLPHRPSLRPTAPPHRAAAHRIQPPPPASALDRAPPLFFPLQMGHQLMGCQDVWLG
jgi:hypothetical protein